MEVVLEPLTCSSVCLSVSYQGPIYAHGEGPAPIPPQGMLVQPEMHIPHPGQWLRLPGLLMLCASSVQGSHLFTSSSGLHPHQSGGAIANPALYGGPPVSLSPGQPQQLLPPPFFPPPGVMTFPYPAMYPSPQVGATFVMLFEDCLSPQRDDAFRFFSAACSMTTVWV